MPTHEESAAFLRDYRRLTPAQRILLRAAIEQFVDDLRQMESGHASSFRPGLVRKLSAVTGVFELRWAPDGRATFSMGESVVTDARHIIWHRCGTHEILP